MQTGPSSVTSREQRGSYSLRATWRAICCRSYSQFPLLLPQVHPIAAPFILWRLKRTGYSNCRVVSKKRGLLVFADR
ncbi:MAG: hypothetical protein A2X83_00765 [Desulfuromonadales bacterium GWD2_54_10]|nr:MAG: hypothetical protein A2X83_00765 [Desulfuromonadales bacterium GWD2_54_10]